MSRFIISRDADVLTLTQPQAGRLLAVGCPLFFLAIASVTLLGLLGLFFQANPLRTGARRVGEGDFFDPASNHLGFLWLLALFLMLVFVPVYVLRAGHAHVVWTFDRAADALLRSGRRLCALRQVEQVRVRILIDPDGANLHRLFLVYRDGCEALLHQSYDDVEIWILAHEIGDFAAVTVAGNTHV